MRTRQISFSKLVVILRPGCGSVNICAVDALYMFGDMAELIKIICTSKLLIKKKVLDQHYRYNIVFIELIPFLSYISVSDQWL